MIVLAIDPGYDRLGIAVLEKKVNGERVLYSSCFETSKTLPFEERFLLVGNEIKRVIKKFKPGFLAIENLFFNKNQKTAMRVAEVRGAIINISLSEGLVVREFTPLQVKVAVTGYGKATKSQVVDMITRLIVIGDKKKKDDEFDAIAIGLTCIASEGLSGAYR